MLLRSSNLTSSLHSRNSRSVSQYYNGMIEYEDISDEEITKMVTDTKLEVKVLKLENEILEKIINRNDPSLMQGVQQAYEYACKLKHSQTFGNASSFLTSKSLSKFGGDPSMLLASPSRTITSPSRISTAKRNDPSMLLASPSRTITSPSRMSTAKRIDSISNKNTITLISGGGPKINVLEKHELVTKEMGIIVDRLTLDKKTWDKKHAMLSAQLEEIDLKVKSIDAATEQFNKEVLEDGWESISQRIPAEVWIRFMTEWVKTCGDRIGKLRLRTSTLRTRFNKIRNLIPLKIKLNQSLLPVDFDITEIENVERQKVIAFKSKQLKQLKSTMAHANLMLNMHKRAKKVQEEYLINIKKAVERRKKEMVRLKQEKKVLKRDIVKLNPQLEMVCKVRQLYEVPDFMEYVELKSDVRELKNQIKYLEYKLHVNRITLKSI